MVLVLFNPDRATDRATSTDAPVPPHEPHPLLVEKVLVGQGADGTEIDHVAGEFVVQGEARHNIDFLVGPAIGDHQLRRAADIGTEPHAAGAHHTTVDEQAHVAQVALAAGEGPYVGPPAGLPVAEVVVLQDALAGLIADGAIDGVPQEQVLLHHRPGLPHLVRGGGDHQAVGGGHRAAGHELGLHLDLARLGVARARLDQAHAATAHDRKTGMVAVVRDLDAGPFGGLDGVDPQAVRQLDLASVYGDFGHVRYRISNFRSQISDLRSPIHQCGFPLLPTIAGTGSLLA